MKIDINAHMIPPKYRAEFYKTVPSGYPLLKTIETLPTLYDLEHRFRIMDKYEGLTQVLTLSLPLVEDFAAPARAAELAQMANDEIAELVTKYPDRFVAGVATLPMNDMDAAMRELDRAIKDLNLKGVQISTPINDKPLDLPEFLPLYDKLADYDLPLWIHPTRTVDYSDYRTMNKSRYMLFSNFGWPYETSAAMTHIVFAGILEKHPNFKIITHHCGGMVPFFEERIIGAYDHASILRGAPYARNLTKQPIEYYRMFYADTAVYGSTAALMCGHAFFGTDRLVFGTDMPYDSEMGDRYTRQTIQSIDRMTIPDADKRLIYEGNARKMLKL